MKAVPVRGMLANGIAHSPDAHPRHSTEENCMDRPQIPQRVRECYWHQDLNCATTTLRLLAEYCNVHLSRQVLDGAVGMHGAGGYGAQCGLVEGTLMFLGILGRARNLPDADIIDLCCRYGTGFEDTFTSLLCHDLRPEGFTDEQQPHLCEGLTCRSISFSFDVIDRLLAAGENVAAAGEGGSTALPSTVSAGV